MKNVMILSGGTSTAWHIAQVLKKYYSKEIFLIICDINPKHLVHTSVLADEFIQVPMICEPEYYATMLCYMDDKKVDVVIPLIDDDIFLFAEDNPDLLSRNIRSSAASRDVINMLSNKDHLGESMRRINVCSPKVYREVCELNEENQYFLKATIGCGSRGARLINGLEAKEKLESGDVVIQEVCHGPEITVDVVTNGNKTFTICRRRAEIKLGVSTKCEIYYDSEIQSIMEAVAAKIKLPSVTCVQFMKNSKGEWTLIDFNLRSGGGSAISAAVGFEAVRYAAAIWLGLEPDDVWLQHSEVSRYVVRTYQEVITQ